MNFCLSITFADVIRSMTAKHKTLSRVIFNELNENCLTCFLNDIYCFLFQSGFGTICLNYMVIFMDILQFKKCLLIDALLINAVYWNKPK